MTKHFLLLLGVLLIFVQSSAAQTGRKQKTKHAGSKVTDLRRADFLNFAYRSSLCSKVFGIPRTVKVRKGNFQNSDSYYRVANKIVYRDLTGNGREEAIVHIRCGGFAGNFSDNEIFIYTLQTGRAKLLARLDTEGLERDYLHYYPGGFLVGISNDGVRVENGHLVVEIFADGSNAAPANIAALDYQLSGARLVLSGKPKRRPA